MKKLLFALMGFSAMLLGSCAEVGPDPDVPPIGDNTLRVTLNVQDHGSASKETRVAATEEEKTVQSLHLLFFEPGGEFVDFLEIDNPRLAEENDIDMTGTLLNVTSAYDILAVANIEIDGVPQYIDGTSVEGWMGQWAGKTRTQVMTEARAWTTANPGIDADELLMSGIGSKAANSFRVSFKLLRNQIRFDVVNRATDYDLVYVGLCNAYPMSKIWNDGTSTGALDYSEGVTRIKNYYEYLDVTALDGYTDNEVHGHFYVYENTSAMPAQNDNITTALIVGLNDGSATSYYRVNIAPNNGPQTLYRNHAYILTINSVLGEGHGRPGDAYDHPEDDGLNYIINQWGDGDAGTSDQDNNSMLSAPYKKIDLDLFTGEIRGHRGRGLSPNSIDITAVTGLAAGSYSELDIIGTPEFHLNGSDELYDGITVTLDKPNSRLVFDPVEVAPETPTGAADELESGDKITGSVTLGFAGLRIIIDVVQTDLVTDFLNVYLPDGGIPRFAPFEGIESEDIRVEASGDWSARIVSETPGAFGFVGTDELEISRLLADDKEFKVETESNNPDARNTRNAFVIITLDKDPLNYSRVVRLTQQQKAEIAITPNRTITFDGTFDNSTEGMADGLAGSLALIPDNTINTFTVLSGLSGEGATAVQNDWTYFIEVPDPNNADVYKTVYIEEGVGHNPQGVQDAAMNWFKISTVHDTDPEVPNNFSVDVLGKNTSGSTRRARIVVYLKNAGAGGAKAAIYLVQQSSSVSISPSSVPAVPKIGGESQAVAVQADASLKWKIASAADFATVSGAHSRGNGVTGLVHHEAELFLADDDDDPANDVEVVVGTNYPITQKFKVKFPKIYYPNRDIPISATVKVSIVDAAGDPTDLSSTITFNQTTLTAATFTAWGMNGSPDYGNLGNTYNRGWDGNSGAWGLKQISGFKYLGSGPVYTDAAIHSSVNYLHVVPHISGTNGNNYTWKVVKDYMKRDAFTVIASTMGESRGPLNNANSPLVAAGYPTLVFANGDRNGMIDPENDDTKIYQFLVDKGHNPISNTLTDGNNYLFVDGNNTSMSKALLPESAVVLVSKHQGGDNTPVSNDALMVIDIENKFIWVGDLQIFWYDTWLTNGRGAFLENIMYFVANASKYGSHFTDMFLEENVPDAKQTPEIDGGRYAQPAPWDDAYWGANGGVPTK